MISIGRKDNVLRDKKKRLPMGSMFTHDNKFYIMAYLHLSEKHKPSSKFVYDDLAKSVKNGTLDSFLKTLGDAHEDYEQKYFYARKFDDMKSMREFLKNPSMTVNSSYFGNKWHSVRYSHFEIDQKPANLGLQSDGSLILDEAMRQTNDSGGGSFTENKWLVINHLK